MAAPGSLGLDLRKEIWAGGGNLEGVGKGELIQGDCRLGDTKNSFLESPSSNG